MIRIGFYCFRACFKIPLLQFAFSDPLSKNLKTLSIVKRQYRIYKHLTQQNLLYCILYCIVIDISHGYSCDCYPIAIWLYVAEEILYTATQLGLCREMWRCGRCIAGKIKAMSMQLRCFVSVLHNTIRSKYSLAWKIYLHNQMLGVVARDGENI